MSSFSIELEICIKSHHVLFSFPWHVYRWQTNLPE